MFMVKNDWKTKKFKERFTGIGKKYDSQNMILCINTNLLIGFWEEFNLHFLLRESFANPDKKNCNKLLN